MRVRWLTASCRLFGPSRGSGTRSQSGLIIQTGAHRTELGQLAPVPSDGDHLLTGRKGQLMLEFLRGKSLA